MEEDTVNNMTELARMTRESERMDTELSLAASLQRNALPSGDEISGLLRFCYISCAIMQI